MPISHYKSLETLSCHSNQSAWASAIKNNSFVEANVMNMSAKFQLHPPYDFWGEDFWIFVRKFTFYVAMATNQIKFSDLDKILMNRRGLLKKHFCKKNLNICSEAAKVANFHFSHYKSMETISCHSNQSFYPMGQKIKLFISPAYRCYVWNIARIGFMASEEMSFENVDDGRMTSTDGRRMPAYTRNSPMSRRGGAKNVTLQILNFILVS